MKLTHIIGIVLLFLVCFAVHKLTSGNGRLAPENAGKQSLSMIDYSVVVPPEELPQFQDRTVYRQPAREKDALWMDSDGPGLFPKKDSNDPYTGVI